MSWKLFGQIVLLMIIGAVILGALKCSIYRCHLKSRVCPQTMMDKGYMEKESGKCLMPR